MEKEKIYGWGGAASIVGSVPLVFVDIKMGIAATVLGAVAAFFSDRKLKREQPFYITIEKGRSELNIVMNRRSRSVVPEEFRGSRDYYGTRPVLSSYVFASVAPDDDEALVQAIVNAKSQISEWTRQYRSIDSAAKRGKKLIKA